VSPDELLEEVARRFGYLADATRLRILRALHEHGEASVGELAKLSGVPLASVVSQHLNRLAVGGIVGRRRLGTSIIHWIAEPTVSELCDLVCGRLAAEATTGEARIG
jgi:DNA-binding transcriptional ArsR family regulator